MSRDEGLVSADCGLTDFSRVRGVRRGVAAVRRKSLSSRNIVKSPPSAILTRPHFRPAISNNVFINEIRREISKKG